MSPGSHSLAAAAEVLELLQRLVDEGRRDEAQRELRRLRGIFTDIGEELGADEDA